MKKLGFTLAEVLITLGIIGVVAALTTPSLVSNIGTAKIGPSLAKFNNTFSSAIGLVKEQDHLTGFHAGRENIAREISLLSNHIIMVPPDDNHPYTFTDALGRQSHTILSDATLQQQINDMQNAIMNGPNPNNWNSTQLNLLVKQSLENPIVNRMNDGTVMAIAPRSTMTPIIRGVYRGVVAEVIVDIDGDKGTNKAGIDVFGFLLDSTGLLIPAGSAAHRFVGQSGTQFITAQAECHTSTANLNENFACTGRIADNNWSTKGINLD